VWWVFSPCTDPSGVAGSGRPRSSTYFEERGTMLITILVILAIIALALFIWRNMAGRRV
jgi:hypothetical protein